MRKLIFIALLCIIFKITGRAQQNQPPLVLGGISISAGTHLKQSPYAITSTEEVAYTANVTYMAGNKIQLLPGFQVSELTNTGKFLGKIQLSDYEIVSMNNTWSFPKYNKMELGIKLPASIQDQINTFFTSNGITGLNPYDPDKLRIKFFFTINGTTYQRNAFYFRDFIVNNNYWNEVSTAYPHRVRFAPPQTGNGTFSFEVWINGVLQSTGNYGNTGTFTVTPSNNHGHLTTANNLNTRKFFFEDGTPFFGIGQNMWAGGDTANGCLHTWGDCVCPATYIKLRNWMSNLANNGGNFTRLRIDKNQFPVMWPNQQLQVGDPPPDPDLSKYLYSYDNNQKHMWELDKTFDLMEARDVHAILCLLEDQDYKIHSAYVCPQNADQWALNPFSAVLGQGYANCKSFFSGNSTNPAPAIFKKYLDYVVARWGYSTSLAGWEMINETYNICDMATGFHPNPNNSCLEMDGTYQPYVTDAAFRTDVDNWTCNMKSYLGQQYPSHPTTTGVTDIWGGDIQDHRLSCLDFWTNNEYSNFSTINDMHYFLRDWNRFNTVFKYFGYNKPFVFGELGMPDNTNHIDSYNDRTFHNTNWITAVSGSLGTGLYWNDMDQYGHVDHRANFKALRAFSDAIDWTVLWQPYRRDDQDQFGGFVVNGKSVYTFNSATPDGQRAIAYALNASSNWTIDNPSSYIVRQNTDDLSYWQLLQAQGVDINNVGYYDIDPSQSGAYGYNPPVVIKGMWTPSGSTPYTVDKYKTYGNGGLLSSSTQYAIGNSTQLLFYEDMPAYIGPAGYPDYAYFVHPFGTFRSSDTLDFTNKDTVNLDPYFISAKEDYSFTYDWGNGTMTNDSIAHVHYSNPGTYTVTLTVHDNKADTTATYTQVVKVADAVTEMNDASITLYPNPATNNCFIKYDADIFNAPNIEIYDQLGKMVLKMALNQTSGVNISSLKSGMYYLKFFGKDYQKVCKLIKQ
jgi:hypothetical protein